MAAIIKYRLKPNLIITFASHGIEERVLVRFVFKCGTKIGVWFLRLYLGSFLGGSKLFNL